MASNCSRMVEVDRLIFADNVRSPECMQVPAMVESFRRAGSFKPNHPLVLSEKPDGSYLVLNGNRRGTGLIWLRDKDREAYQQILPTGKVPAIVHKGLTVEEEANLRIDHSSDEDRVPLDDWSIFLAIKQLVKVGIDSQERMAIKLGLYISANTKKKGQPNRSYVQTRVNLARLPEFVQDEIRKLTLDKDSTLLRWAHVAGLYKVYNREYTTYPECNGPEFQALWKKCTTPPEAIDTDSDDVTEPKELSPAEAIKRSQSASSKGLKTALLIVTKQSDADLADLDERMVAAESALRTLTEIREYLGEKEFAELVDVSTKQAADRRQAEEKAETDQAETDQAEESPEYEHPAVA